MAEVKHHRYAIEQKDWSYSCAKASTVRRDAPDPSIEPVGETVCLRYFENASSSCEICLFLMQPGHAVGTLADH